MILHLDLIREFAALQSMLLGAFDTVVVPELGAGRWRARSGQLDVGGAAWNWHIHGQGVSFCRQADERIVDCHDTLDVQDVFDPWRLTQYIASAYGSDLQFSATLKALESLLATGEIVEITDPTIETGSRRFRLAN